MDVEDLVTRFQKAKKAGPGKWVACCPAHEDRSPSLSIKGTESGTILIHCFAGCSTEDIVAAVGVEMTDLFPPTDRKEWTPDKPLRFNQVRFGAIDALRCLSNEGAVVTLLAADMAEGKMLTPDEINRLYVAVGRLTAAMDYVGINQLDE